MVFAACRDGSSRSAFPGFLKYEKKDSSPALTLELAIGKRRQRGSTRAIRSERRGRSESRKASSDAKRHGEASVETIAVLDLFEQNIIPL